MRFSSAETSYRAFACLHTFFHRSVRCLVYSFSGFMIMKLLLHLFLLLIHLWYTTEWTVITLWMSGC